jgi:hypothetical protein
VTGPLVKTKSNLNQNVSFVMHFVTKVRLLREIRFVSPMGITEKKVCVTYLAVNQNFGFFIGISIFIITRHL